MTPKCPYCGAEMVPRRESTGMTRGFDFTQCRACAARSPAIRALGGAWGGSQKKAIAAAMQRYAEPNRVLTLEEVRDRGGCPVWCEDRGGSGAWALVDNGEDKCFDADYGDWEYYCYGWTNERGWRAWTGKPTDEERKAVMWENDELYETLDYDIPDLITEEHELCRSGDCPAECDWHGITENGGAE